jgi:sucrose-phosphate synthase
MAAGNEWINGYLEAILDAGARLRGQRQGQGHGHGGAAPPLTTAALPRLLAEAGGQGAAAYSPTRYFVEEVVSRFDDRDLHKTWTKVPLYSLIVSSRVMSS